MSSPKVSVGLATWVGYGLAAVAVALGVVENGGSLTGPGKWLILVGAAKAALTSLGRQWQAGAITAPHVELASGAPAVAGDVTVLPAPVPEALPSDAEEDSAPPPPEDVPPAEAVPVQPRPETAVVPDAPVPVDEDAPTPAPGA